MINSKEFDQKLLETESIFKVDMVNKPMFELIQKHRPIYSVPLDLDRVREFNSKLNSGQLYLTTDMAGLYLIDEKTLKMFAIYLELFKDGFDETTWTKYVTNEKNSIEYIVEREGNLEKLSHTLVNTVIVTAERSQHINLFEVLLDRVSSLVDYETFIGLKQLLTAFTRKELDVFFKEFDKKYTSQLDYRYSDSEQITIYRGENSKSQSYKDTFSWTTSKEVATWFATRFEGGRVLTANVAKNRILYIYKDDSESEVLVKGEDLNNVTIENL